MITASMLYDFTRCPYRVELDLFGDPAKKDPISPFVQMLWERGRLYEREVLDGLEIPCTDLSSYAGDEKERRTLEAMTRGDKIILGGRIRQDDLLGDPDIIRREGNAYIAGDIKSGAGEEGDEDNRKPKKHYAVQLALYTDILERKKLSIGRRAFVWDIHGEEVPYDFSTAMGPKTPKTFWEYYQEILESIRPIVSKQGSATPACTSECKQCHWITNCKKQMKVSDDLTLIPELGRSRREPLLSYVRTVKELAESTRLPSKVPGIGSDMLHQFQRRARLLSGTSKTPYLLQAINLPRTEIEIFFDVETDPMRDVCYLHGFVERENANKGTEKYISFFANNPNEDEEKEAFAGAFAYLHERRAYSFYFYSKYERTIWRKLQSRYSDICSADDIETLFGSKGSIDLYEIVKKYTEWPTHSYSIKELAVHLGFAWRDTHPSGAASIEWFDQWVRTGEAGHKQRILDYNEDDCRATRVLLDGIRQLKIGP